MNFEYRVLANTQSGKRTVDTKFAASADVSCIRIINNGLVHNK